MLKHTLHCDVCLRPQAEERGWFAVIEILRPKVLDPDSAHPVLAVDRTLIVRPLGLGEQPDGGRVVCGLEDLHKLFAAFADAVLREQAARRA
jgi:hypothetical protein